MIYLVETFYSIQGEGKFIGSPSIFVRLGGCNLSCKGFGVKNTSPIDNSTIIGCDSIRAVNRKHYSHLWEPIEDTSALIEKINYHQKDLPFRPDIIFTGGEPLIYFENKILLDTISHFHKKGHRITFETNATIEINFKKYPIYKEVIFAMSVKLNNSKEEKSNRFNKNAINNILNYTNSSFFKFVLNKNDIITSEINEILKYFNNVSVYCMPMSGSKTDLEANSQEIVQFCLKHGYIYSDRLHIRLWDNEPKR
jgi:organic radical activating enzyme